MKTRIPRGATIVGAWAASYSGPGWANQVIEVLVRVQGKYDLLTLQRDEQTAEMDALRGVSSAAHYAMMRAVERSRDER